MKHISRLLLLTLFINSAQGQTDDAIGNAFENILKKAKISVEPESVSQQSKNANLPI